MRNLNKIFIFLTIIAIPAAAQALEMPAVETGPQTVQSVSAQSFIVVDENTGFILAQRNSHMPRVPASLTKLVTALTFLDTKPNLNKVVAIKKSDQIAGGCADGGACLATKPGVAYRLRDLLNASLIASHNNATAAMARSSGLSLAQFAAKMNEKAKSLGMNDSYFMEPTGMSPENITTAADYAKAVKAALENKTIGAIVSKQGYSFKSTNNKRYVHTVKNTDKLLGDEDITVKGGKTGYLEESQYNFGSQVSDFLGNTFIIVVLGSENYASSFSDTKQLALQASALLAFGGTAASVLGTSTESQLITSN